MKTTISCRDLYLFERLVSKLVKSSELPTTVSFAPCSEGLQFAAFCSNAVLTFTVPSVGDVEPFSLPWATVKEFGAKKPHYVDLIVNGKNVTLSWMESGIPQTKSVTSLGLNNKCLPPLPDKTVAHSFGLFGAMVEAAKCVDDENKRYALGSICLRGTNNQIISTDGKQALIQDGFDFPFDGDVLCPVTKIYGSKELREINETVKVGVADDWIYFGVGSVSLWLQKVDGKFPLLDQFTKNIDDHTWLYLNPADAVFVSERIDILPGKDNKDDPVYLELDKKSIAVRGHDTQVQTATELRMEESCYEGDSVTMSVNRKFLKNALDFGMVRLGLDPKDTTPIIGYGDKKTFIVMPLGGDEPKVEADKLTVLMSNAKVSVAPKIERSVKTDKPIPTTQTCRTVKSRSKDTAKSKGKVAVLDDAMRLRTNLRETLGNVNDLIRSIKSQRRQDKLLRDTVNSLRKLQNV